MGKNGTPLDIQSSDKKLSRFNIISNDSNPLEESTTGSQTPIELSEGEGKSCKRIRV